MPVVTVSSNIVAVGEFVQVTVTSGFILQESSTFEEQTIPEAVFGLCFIPSEELTVDSERYCDTLSLPDGFVVADGEPLYTVQDVTVRHGETVEVSHNIRLSATEAKGVTIVGYHGFLGEDGESVEPVGNLQTERAFVRFQ